jgi:hypothetical protein
MKRRNFLGASAGRVVFLKGLFVSERPHGFAREPRRVLEDPDVIVKILGTAQDGGIPQIGCDCGNCSRARKDQKHSRLIELTVTEINRN